MTEQTKAQRLADAYEATGLRGHIEAAAELRRLDANEAELLHIAICFRRHLTEEDRALITSIEAERNAK